MAKGANGTIDLASFNQVNQQRLAIEARNLANAGGRSFGIAKDRLTTLFSDSPLLAINRMSSVSAARDPDGIQDASGDIYEMYANVVDGDTSINGFGFEGTDKVSLNYRHNENPFVEGGQESLKLGSAATELDNSGRSDHYLGFPDLLPNELTNPAGLAGATATPGLEKVPANNFGSTTEADRDKLSQAYADSTIGQFNADAGNTLGMYFKNTYTS